MGAMATVQASVDAEVARRATTALKAEGLTVEEAVRLMLERTAEAGELPFAREEFKYLKPGEDSGYDAWFETQVQEALDDPRPPLSAEEAHERMRAHRESVAMRLAAR